MRRNEQKGHWRRRNDEERKEKRNCRIARRKDFLGGPVVKTWSFYCRGHGFDPWLGN